MKAIRVIIPFVIGLAFFSCAKKEQVVRPTPQESEIGLHETTWKLVSFETSGGMVAPLPDSESFKIFFSAGPTFEGTTIRNTYGGPYVSDSRTKSMRVEYINSTRIAGGPFEERFYDALRNALRYRAFSDGKSGKLRIFYGTNQDILNFAEER